MLLLTDAQSPARDCAHILSNPELFRWGLLGGAISYLLLIALPAFNRMIGPGDSKFAITARKICGSVGIMVVTLALGGVTPIIFGDATHPGQALVYGLAWPGIMSGLGNFTIVVGSVMNRTDQ